MDKQAIEVCWKLRLPDKTEPALPPAVIFFSSPPMAGYSGPRLVRARYSMYLDSRSLGAHSIVPMMFMLLAEVQPGTLLVHQRYIMSSSWCEIILATSILCTMQMPPCDLASRIPPFPQLVDIAPELGFQACAFHPTPSMRAC
jgi:hypothetical protein